MASRWSRKTWTFAARFTPENLRRIESAFKDFHPRHRLAANKLPLELTDELCESLKNMYLQTDLGILDCFSRGRRALEILMLSFDKAAEPNFPLGGVICLKLTRSFQAKQAAGRRQDLIAVAQLQAIKEKNEQQKNLF